MADGDIQLQISFKPALATVEGMFDKFNADNPLRDTINKILFRIEGLSKQLTPVDSGRLRASEATSWLLEGIGGMVSTNVDYAIYVHEGTRRMRPRPFLETAANLVMPQLEGEVATRLDSEFTKAFKRI